jgi:hypothetical protein
LTVTEVVYHFKTSKGTVRRWFHKGMLPGICILHPGQYQKIRIRQETVDILFAEAALREERQRACEQEEQAT